LLQYTVERESEREDEVEDGTVRDTTFKDDKKNKFSCSGFEDSQAAPLFLLTEVRLKGRVKRYEVKKAKSQEVGMVMNGRKKWSRCLTL
jgi:hypothetical protein